MYDVYPSQIAQLDRTRLEQAITSRCQVIPVADDVVLARVLTRYKMFLRPSDIGFGCHVMMDGFWEIWLTQFFARTVKPGMCVVDIGANFGYYTMLFADMVGAAGKVVAAEPNPDVASLLQRSVNLNGFAGRTEVLQAAMSDAAGGTVAFFAPDGEPKNAAMGMGHGGAGTQYFVDVTNLEALANRIGKIDLIKVDAEGAEAAIIAGMGAALEAQAPAMVLEFNPVRGTDPAGLLDRLIAIYGGLTVVGFDSIPTPVTKEKVMSAQDNEDWLLYLSRG